jgi:hypothetical protein
MKIIAAFLILAIFGTTQQSKAQNTEGFIYGKITTIDNDTYTGALRWGKEEIYWTDFFNATKTKNEYLRYIDKDDRIHASREDSWTKKWMSWGKSPYENVHQWVCQFGDLRAIEITGRSNIEIELKDGSIINLGDGSNDVGAEIKVIDSELGTVELSWNRIEKIEFIKTPAKLDNAFGERLFGTVETRNGIFTGIVQWDHDERISTDELDGETEDGEFAIEFGKIERIAKYGNKSQVQLLSGRTLTLGGTNDVDDGNRGIIVTVEGVGRVDIPWDEFLSVTFDHKKKISGPGYNDFTAPKLLNGTARTKDGRIFSGQIAFDLDETLDIEIIQGMDDEIEYLIPLRNIKTIAPKSYDNATITLKNGQSVLIGEGQDVSDRNDGILVFSEKNDPIHIPWDDLREVEFK